ncbi:NADH-quinone oxidoreductase subunit C, partial [Escherichia coli]|nr:NADH-quinone oxidoreductase subunit C [Escherichia coli]
MSAVKTSAPRFTSNEGVIDAAKAVLGDILLFCEDSVGEV